jgi:hypothetical protein
MIGFLIKKTFFDLWDNLFRIALVNLGFVVSAAIPILLPTVLSDIPLLALAAIVLGMFWCVLYLVANSPFGKKPFRLWHLWLCRLFCEP